MNAVSYAGLPWEIQTSEVTERIPGVFVGQMITMLEQWQEAFVPEDTWVQQACAVPSLFAAIDFVLDASGGISVYEIDDRPCGLGIASLVSREFAHSASVMREQKWPEEVTCVSDRAHPTDDSLFFGPPCTLREAVMRREGLFLVRNARRNAADFEGVAPLSVSSISKEGDKTYGIHMGLWKVVTAIRDDTDRAEQWYLDTDISSPCVFKPVAGSFSQQVRVHFPAGMNKEGLSYRGGGAESENRIIKLIRSQPGRRMLCQRFIPPMQRRHGLNVVYRLYFGFNLLERQWEALGGFWMGSERLIVQGSSSTIFGPLEMGD